MGATAWRLPQPTHPQAPSSSRANARIQASSVDLGSGRAQKDERIQGRARATWSRTPRAPRHCSLEQVASFKLSSPDRAQELASRSSPCRHLRAPWHANYQLDLARTWRETGRSASELTLKKADQYLRDARTRGSQRYERLPRRDLCSTPFLRSTKSS